MNDDHDVDDVDVNVDGDGDGDDDGNGYFRWSIGVDAALHHKASMIMKMRRRNWPHKYKGHEIFDKIQEYTFKKFIWYKLVVVVGIAAQAKSKVGRTSGAAICPQTSLCPQDIRPIFR